MTLRIQSQGDDELARLSRSFNRLLDRLHGSLRTVARAATEVASASVETSSSSEQVAGASEEQSSAATNIAASIEELTVSITHVGEHAAQTNERVTEAGRLARDGEAVVQQTVGDIERIAGLVENSARSIEELEAQSSKISQVIGVIRDVADQTNLLALNAAIEAARAGEQGRGFAVVADEVRKLAERTATSTLEITQTINTMREQAQQASEHMRTAVGEVGNSVSRAAAAGEAIRQIATSAHDSVSMVQEITSSILEQSTASTAVAQSVEHIAQMAEESATAARAGPGCLRTGPSGQADAR